MEQMTATTMTPNTNAAASDRAKQRSNELALARTRAAAVKRFLSALPPTPTGGRKLRKVETIKADIAATRKRLAEAVDSKDKLRELQLHQKLIDLDKELSEATVPEMSDEIVAGFIAHAAVWSATTKIGPITWGAWVAMGVDEELLSKAGIPKE